MVKTIINMLVSTVLILAPAASWAEDTEQPGKRGARWGAKGGAALGLVLGAATGDAKMAAAGAAVGAASGAAAGAMYEYDQSKQDDRTQMMADAIAGSKSQDVVAGETVGDAGKRHFQDFTGDWTLEIWALDENGKRITATGKARGLSAGENSVRIVYRDISVPSTGESFGGGDTLISYQPGQGFFLENNFTIADETLKMVGEYLADRNAYNFFLTGNTGGEMISGGILRSSVRLEIRSSGPSLFTAETYTHIDGEEVLVQSYRFIREAG